jgi:hypothetical protein
MLGTKMEAAALLLTPPTPEGRGLPSLRPKPNQKSSKVFEVVQGQTTNAVVQRQARSMLNKRTEATHRDELVLGKVGMGTWGEV